MAQAALEGQAMHPIRPATLLLLTTLAGCALGPANPPTVQVQDVRLTGLGLLQQDLAVTLCVTNPNDTEIAFRRVTADLDVSGAPLAAGVSDLGVRLPPHASTAVPFTVATTVQNIGPQLLGVLQSGVLDYRIHGTVTLQTLGLTLPYARVRPARPALGWARPGFRRGRPCTLILALPARRGRSRRQSSIVDRMRG